MSMIQEAIEKLKMSQIMRGKSILKCSVIAPDMVKQWLAIWTHDDDCPNRFSEWLVDQALALLKQAEPDLSAKPDQSAGAEEKRCAFCLARSGTNKGCFFCLQAEVDRLTVENKTQAERIAQLEGDRRFCRAVIEQLQAEKKE